jgi:hypothetical protein
MFAVECNRFYGSNTEIFHVHCSHGTVQEPVLVLFMIGVFHYLITAQNFSYKVLNLNIIYY